MVKPLGVNSFHCKNLVENSSTGHEFDPGSLTLQSSETDLRTVASFSVTLLFFKMKDGVWARTCKPQRTETLILLRRRKEDIPTLTPSTPHTPSLLECSAHLDRSVHCVESQPLVIWMDVLNTRSSATLAFFRVQHRITCSSKARWCIPGMFSRVWDGRTESSRPSLVY